MTILVICKYGPVVKKGVQAAWSFFVFKGVWLKSAVAGVPGTDNYHLVIVT